MFAHCSWSPWQVQIRLQIAPGRTHIQVTDDGKESSQQKPAWSKADALYFLEWIDGLEAKFISGDRVPRPGLCAHVKGQLDAARAVYRKMAG